MWILTEDKKQIINTLKSERFYISKVAKNRFKVLHSRLGSVRSDLGTYDDEELAITAIGYIFDSLDKEETCHTMF